MPSIGRLRYVEAIPPAGVRRRGTLLLVHAFPLNARMWEPQLSLSELGWHVVAPHLRGFDGGLSEPPAASIDDYAGDVIDLLDALHADTAVIGGLSMGGYVTFGVLRHAPDYFQGIVLADTRPQADTSDTIAARRQLLETARQKGPAAVADAMLPKLIGTTTARAQPSVADRVRDLVLANPTDAIVAAIEALIARPDSTPLLRSIRCPALIVVGSEDAITPPDVSEAMHREIAGSELVVIENAGHLSSVEQPQAFTSALARFLTHRV